jgi:hypothetical protein
LGGLVEEHAEPVAVLVTDRFEPAGARVSGLHFALGGDGRRGGIRRGWMGGVGMVRSRPVAGVLVGHTTILPADPGRPADLAGQAQERATTTAVR